MTDQQENGRAVLWDGICGEPIGWRKIGDPIIAEEWNPDGQPIVLTKIITVDDAIERYGPITEIRVGPGRGWRSVTYGKTRFMSRRLDPRDHPAAEHVRLTVEDHDLEFPCPTCEAKAGEPCVPGPGKHHHRRWKTQFDEMSAESFALRKEVERLDQEVAALRVWGDRLRKQIESPRPRCNRPTVAGTPCRAEAITYPKPIESCRIHLTIQEQAWLAQD